MPQLASPPQLPLLKPLERRGIGLSLFVGAGKPLSYPLILKMYSIFNGLSQYSDAA